MLALSNQSVNKLPLLLLSNNNRGKNVLVGGKFRAAE